MRPTGFPTPVDTPPDEQPVVIDVSGTVRPPRRLDRRGRAILAAAAAVAVVVNAGAAWAYWRVTGSSTGLGSGTGVELTLRGRSDYNRPLTPGSTGDLVVTVTNNNGFPIRITSVSAAAGKIMADDEHREAGCTSPGVTLARRAFPVSWEVPKNTVGAFTIADGLVMSSGGGPACRDASFTVPVHAVGVVS
jgi:hypothetical protein